MLRLSGAQAGWTFICVYIYLHNCAYLLAGATYDINSSVINHKQHNNSFRSWGPRNAQDSRLWQDSLSIMPRGPEMIVIPCPRSQSPLDSGVPGLVFQIPGTQRFSKRLQKTPGKSEHTKQIRLLELAWRESRNLASKRPRCMVGVASAPPPRGNLNGMLRLSGPPGGRGSEGGSHCHDEKNQSIPCRFAFWSYLGKKTST